MTKNNLNLFNKCRTHRDVLSNYAISASSTISFGIELDPGPSSSHFLHQVHGNLVVPTSPSTEHSSEMRTKADGIYTKTANTVISVRTADCLPILLWDDKSKIVMALHAGWRSLTSGIINNGLKIFADNQIPLNKINIILNPAISKQNFEVGEDVFKALSEEEIQLSKEQVSFVSSINSNSRWQVDLQASAALNLLNNGIDPLKINLVQQCTFEKINNWPSYRRDGRVIEHMWSWIKISKDKLS
jgi:YfiH family protein